MALKQDAVHAWTWHAIPLDGGTVVTLFECLMRLISVHFVNSIIDIEGRYGVELTREQDLEAKGWPQKKKKNKNTRNAIPQITN
jgi:hypothetical protein